MVISCGSLSRSAQYSKSKVCVYNWDAIGVFSIPSIEGVVSEIVISNTLAQGINTEEVNQLSGIVSEKTTPCKEGDTFCVRI